MPQAVDRLRNSSTTVMRRMLASIKSVEEVLGGGLLLVRHYHAKNRESGMVVCKLLILRGRNSFFCCDPRYGPFRAVTGPDEKYAESDRLILRAYIFK